MKLINLFVALLSMCAFFGTVNATYGSWITADANLEIDMGTDGYIIDSVTNSVTLTFPDLTNYDGTTIGFKWELVMVLVM